MYTETVNKFKQVEKEKAIIKNGGTYIQTSGRVVDFSSGRTITPVSTTIRKK
jgi:hypothetical protein